MPEPKLSSPVTLENRTLWFGEIELHENQVVISGWTWTARVEETIPLSDINKFYKWPPQLEGRNFRLSRDGQPSISGRMKGVELWATHLEGDERVKVERRI